PQAGYLINASNDSWFGDSLAPHQHLQIARVRSLETGRPMARVTNTGLSALIDADGRLVAQTALNQEAVLRGHLQPMQGVTPFVRWGEAAVLALLLALTLGGSVGRIRQRGG
ncbi:MAG: nitrilase-related carbon-nitrogen hydrolase, partial [Halothiobacillaceae bacterium]|nr:nitrilase-related carbon-nitrogen hydrolase [Halothiobacillaceae bacterium]